MRYLLAALLTFALAVPAMAAFDGPGTTQPSTAASGGGFKGPQGAAMGTVKAALAASDDTYCTVEGRIVEKKAGSKDSYIFEDATGQIEVDIDAHVFGAHTITPQSVVRLHGEVDVKKSGKRELDVDVLEVVK